MPDDRQQPGGRAVSPAQELLELVCEGQGAGIDPGEGDIEDARDDVGLGPQRLQVDVRAKQGIGLEGEKGDSGGDARRQGIDERLSRRRRRADDRSGARCR